METTQEELQFPINMIGNKTIVSPEGIIQLALSKYRHSNCSDGELAAYIAEFLGFVMRYNLIISCVPNKGNESRFRYLEFQKIDGSQ